ncbi:MAG TPA: hypothetical protein VI818_08360 [Candidatus Thermoplasmatota archaeon]|nr:hypothetical protein [Candidatus Thermoplasmatota archaeon]
MQNTVLIFAAMLLSVAFAGCGGGGDGGGTGSPSPTGTTPTTTGPATPPTPFPGQKCSLTYQPNAAPTVTGSCGFTLASNFTTLTITMYVNSTAACYATTAETAGTPPATVTPLIRWAAAAPATDKIEFTGGDLPSQALCGTNPAGAFIKQANPKSGKGVMGTWSFFNQGLRGSNIKIDFNIEAK